MTKKKGKTKQGLLSAKDIMKGFTSYTNKYDLVTMAPIQCIPLEEKDEDWVKWNANWQENMALRELPYKATKLQKLYDMAAGIINKSDYIYNPSGNDISEHLGIIGADNQETLLEMFFPIVPVIVNEFIAEFITSDRSCIVDSVDETSVNEAIQSREDKFKEILQQQAVQMKQIELIKAGIIPTSGDDERSQKINQYYQSEIQAAQQMSQAENQFKKFRNEAAKWANRFIDKFREKFYFNEIELKMFVDSIVADEAIIAFNLGEDSFTPEYLEPRKTWVNISPSKTYYSDANSIVNIDFMSLGEVINTFRKDLNDEQIESLENQFGSLISNNILFAGQEGHSESYYNTNQTYLQNQLVPANIKEAISDQNVNTFLKDIANGGFYGLGSYFSMFSDPKLIRVTRIWWLSQRKYGLLTKIEDDGTTTVSEVDENFIVTEKPVYDNSLLKEQTAQTLAKGEHIEWTYIPEWRYVVKIGQNRQFNIINSETEVQSIYLYGDPIKFQFKGTTNVYGVKPPIEGRRMSERTSVSNSVVQKIRPWQILYNVVNNKILKLMPHDIGPVLVANESSMKTNSLSSQDGREPLTEYMDNIRTTKLILQKDLNTGVPLNGKFLQSPIVVDISTMEKMASYINLGTQINEIAYRTIGFSPQRLGEVGNRETAAGVQQATQSSENQTLVYFEKFINMLMPRVWQTVIEAGQYYTVQSPDFSDSYITDEGDKVLFSIIKDDLLLRDFLVKPVSTAKVKQLMEKIQSLAIQDNTLGATLIDKIYTLKAYTPSEIIEDLEMAEYKRQQQEQATQKAEQDQQTQEQRIIDKRERDKMALQNKQFYDKLSNDRAIAELSANKTTDIPEPEQNISPVDQAKLDQQASSDSTNADLTRQKLNQEDRQNKDKTALEREKLAQQDRDSQRNYQIAVENKQQADVQFQRNQELEKQKLRNKNKK